MFVAIIIAFFLSPIIISLLSPKAVQGDFGRWMRIVSVYTLMVGVLVLVAPVVLKVINPQWFEDFKDLLVNDVILNLKERSRTSMVLCYVVRQIAIAISAIAVCLAAVQLIRRRYGNTRKVVTLFIGIMLLSFQMPLDNGEFYQKLFVAIEWAAEHFWYFVVGILSFCAGILVRSIKR